MEGSSMPSLPLTYLQSSQPSINMVYNMPTINYIQPQNHVVPNFPHPIITFIIPIVLNMIEIKCQCKGDSPFDTNPITMWFSLSCLMAYCFAYGIELRVSSSASHTLNRRSDLTLLRRGSALFGSLCLVSLASILLPSVKPFLYGFCGLLSISDVVQSFKMAWDRIDDKILSKFCGPCGGQQVQRNILPV